MAQHSLYRRYRPRRFGEIKGQEHVVRALRNAVANDAEGHAYLFSGPRGTGKTSTARILAKALNCTDLRDGEPCCECDSCLAIQSGRSFDLFELDAASNNGVDAVRDLVERSAVGSPGRTKVYILDEVHMLTAAASNALLKTLEEPPDHVRFVLATTDPQKVLPTIRSRTQHFEFGLLSAAELTEHVRWVAQDAGLDVDDEAVAHAVRQGRGSVRDTLSALDQVVAAGGVLVRSEPVDQLFSALAGVDSGAAVVAVADALAQGHDPRVLGEAFLAAVRDAFLLSLGVETPHLVDTDREHLGRWAEEIGTPGLTRAMERVGQSLVDMRNAADPRVPLEVALVRLTTGSSDSGPGGGPTTGGSGAVAAGDLDEIRARLDRLEAGGGGARNATGSGPTAAEPGPEEGATEPGDGDAPVAGATGAAGAAADARSALGAAAGSGGERRHGPGSPGGGADRGGRDGRQGDRPAADRSGGGSRGGTGRAAPPPPPPRRRGGEPPTSQQRKSQPSSPDPESTARESQGGTPENPSPERPQGGTPELPSPEGGPVGPQAGDLPDRDALVIAFGDEVVPQLKGIAKAIFTGGRFVAVTDGAAVFALDNAPTRDRAEKHRPQVEQLLSAHFGTRVPLRLVVESGAAAHTQSPGGDATGSTDPGASDPAGTPNPAAGGRTASSPPVTGGPSAQPAERTPPAPAPQDPVTEEAELMAHVDQLEDADVTVSGVDKLTAAFPGAELIDTEEPG